MKRLLLFTLLTQAFLYPSAGLQERIQEPDDVRMKRVLSNISSPTIEEAAIIEKVHTMKPEINEQTSSKSLIQIVQEYTFCKGKYGINPLGWEAHQKRSGRWQVLFHFQDYNKSLLSAEWEYNPETKKLYPFEFQQSPAFWMGKGEKTPCRETDK